ncbi:hypothetical protein EB169_10020 [archaeon]|nr:hypothetical protein [archaeon]
MQVVINLSGTFSISQEAVEFIRKKIKIKSDKITIGPYSFDNDRSNYLLIEAVNKLKKKANGINADLKIVEIPDDIEWGIHGCSGREWIAEKHRTWR